MSANINVYRRDGHDENVLNRLQVFFQRQILCDVVIIAGIDGTRVPAHRILISANSLYFSNLFANRDANDETEVRIENVSGRMLEDLINYCYSGHMEINTGNVKTLLTTVSQLRIIELVNACEDFLNNNPITE